MHDVDHARFSLGGDIFTDVPLVHSSSSFTWELSFIWGAERKECFSARVLLSGGAGMAFGTPD
jgi:hypothetical protein